MSIPAMPPWDPDLGFAPEPVRPPHLSIRGRSRVAEGAYLVDELTG